MGNLKLLILLLYVCSYYTVQCCGGKDVNSMQYGNVTSDQDLEVNSTLTIQCSLYNNSITYKNQTYFVTSESLQFKFGKDYVKNFEIVDNYTIEYTVENAQINDSGLYSCYMTLPGVNQYLLVCPTYVAVGYQPLPVQNFSCISEEFTNLTCSWVKPFNPVKTDYKLSDIVYHSWKRPCPDVLNETSCRWRQDSKPQYRRYDRTLYFILISNNSLGTHEDKFVVENFKIVKPGIPRNIMFINVTQTSLVFRWSPPKHMEYEAFPPGLDYSIQYEPISSKGPTREVIVHSLSDGLVEIEDLVPHTDYRFKIRCRSREVDNDNFWSPTAYAVERTEADVPYLAPEMTSSSFDVENILGNRTVTVYWKAVPPEFENGADFHYVIEFHVHHVPIRKARDNYRINVGKATMQSFPYLDSHTAYFFKIYASNQMGPSLNSTQIVIDKTDRLLEKPKELTVISYGQGKFNLSWKASNQRPYNFTLYWCKTLKPFPFKCDGPLDWLYTTKTKHVLQLPENSNYQFAVSANDDDQTSGMSWASCVVYYKGADYKIKKVEITPKNATSLKVQWALDCEAQKIMMREYQIHYCEFSGPCSNDATLCSDWQHDIISNVSSDDHVIGNLKPYTYYMAFMRAHTINGWSSNSNLACEMTMPTAPGDPPNNVRVASIDKKYIFVSFEAPKIPNGIITRYIAYYNKSDGTSHHKELRGKELLAEDGVYTAKLMDFMAYYTNYSIEIVACVDQACSEKSKPVYAFTEISNPDIINPPRIEVLDQVVNISWDDPILTNGPLDYFQILMEGQNSSEGLVYNVSKKNYLALKVNCSATKEAIYTFRVRAVNVRDGNYLPGHYSKPTKSEICVHAYNIGIIIGIAIGATFGILALVLLLFLGITWMKSQIDGMRKLQIQLPKDLDSPMENPLSSYDKFKNGLQTNHDSGIPCDTSYERLCEFVAEKELGRVIEENSHKLKRKSSGRNNSGESTTSGKCHDSISSSNTTKTHLSIDSGAEVDSPPSPDGLFSDTSSTHTTPRSYKPDLTIVQECNGSISKDSGLDRDGTGSFMNPIVELPSKFTYFVRKKNFPLSNIHIPNNNNIHIPNNNKMPSYSKFTIVGGANIPPPFIPYGEQSLGLLEQQNFSTSEPSVAELDVDNGSEPLMAYSKFGLARSAGNGLNIANQPLSVNNKVGYSKFGTVYRALKRQDSRNIPILNNAVQNTCPKFIPQHPQTFTALNVMSHQPAKPLPLKENDKAYSKFGVSCPKNPPVNGYVCFRDRLTYPTADTSSGNQAYSKLGMTADGKAPESDHTKENGVIINPADLPSLPLSSQSNVASFPNKDAAAQNAKEAKLNDSFDKEENSSGKLDASVGNHKSGKDNVVDEGDIDCIINDANPSLLDEITSDLGNKLIPTNFSISANNDSKGFLLLENNDGDTANQFSNIMDSLFGVYDFHIPEIDGSMPISISMDDLNVAKIPVSNAKDSSVTNHSADSSDFCKQCENLVTKCSCEESKNSKQTEVVLNGHSSPLPNLPAEYVSLGSNPSC